VVTASARRCPVRMRVSANALRDISLDEHGSMRAAAAAARRPNNILTDIVATDD
jgi:ribosomal protein L28